MKISLYSISLFLFSLLYSLRAHTQSKVIDSLQKVLQFQKEDSNKVKTLNALADALYQNQPGKAAGFANKATQLATRLHYKLKTKNARRQSSDEDIDLDDADEAFKNPGNASKMVNQIINSVKSGGDSKNQKNNGSADINPADIFEEKGDFSQALSNYLSALAIQKQKGDTNGVTGSYFNLGKIYTKQNKLNEAFDYFTKGISLAKELGSLDKLQGGYYNLTKIDSSQGNYKQAYEHYKLYSLYRDSLIKEETEKKALQSKMQYEFDKKEAIAKAEQAKKDAEQRRIKNLQYFTITGLIILLLVIVSVAFIQWKNNNQKKKANALLQQQNEKVENTLTELKATQSQLIHSEKMASLGELTAGIAHEIQNPLNFVNNFSEVNGELIDELKNELKAGNKEEAISIANDIKENEEKINHHGKRADSIVKGMLQHSRVSTGQKELTDINALADEYLRLGYHGLRAKNKSFNSAMLTDFDSSIKKINIVPQDIGRVLLNLFTNAFYSVSKKKGLPDLLKGDEEYEPVVTVTTKRAGSSPGDSDSIEILVKDNGIGIPQEVLGKIFHPFFTTKPSGQGTGLGLSLSYDIIKAHGGEIKVETKEGEGAEFTIKLPAV